jgi:hypothetical protein
MFIDFFFYSQLLLDFMWLKILLVDMAHYQSNNCYLTLEGKFYYKTMASSSIMSPLVVHG